MICVDCRSLYWRINFLEKKKKNINLYSGFVQGVVMVKLSFFLYVFSDELCILKRSVV